MIGSEYLLMVTIAYPIWSALLIIATGLFLAELIERRDPPIILLIAASMLMAIRFGILAVSLGSYPAWMERYVAQQIAATLDFAALTLLLPYVLIVLRRRWQTRRVLRDMDEHNRGIA